MDRIKAMQTFVRIVEAGSFTRAAANLVDRSRKLHDMTFSSLDAGNRAAVNDNIAQNIDFYGDSVKLAVDKIATVTV